MDCEYNRDGDEPKRIVCELAQKTTTADDIHAKTSYPDIIVHHRRSNDHNVAVIEAKKTTGHGQDWDWIKLRAFREPPYRYQLLVSVLFCIHPHAPSAVLRFDREDGPVIEIPLLEPHPG